MKGFYEGAVYRPPSEWDSLIIQSTIGCSHNKCTFCSMYKDKNFRIKTVEEVKNDLEKAKDIFGYKSKIFLADGDALIRKTEEQLEILNYIKATMPQCTRITCYASPKSILLKSKEDLERLKEAGLAMVYLGLESGSNQVLKAINKGVTAEEIIEAAVKIKAVGIKLSVTAIIGLGGRENYKLHGIETGKALSKMNPDYIGLLTLMLEEGTLLKDQWEEGKFQLPTQEEMLRETLLILENLDSKGTIFRANHASNYLNLKGTLNEDRDKMINLVKEALQGKYKLKDESFRGL